MALAEFLLARIAEDEAQIRDGLAGIIALSLATRILAECEAKRRIVERARPPLSTGFPVFGPTYAYSSRDEWVLKLLALPYADHPDYQQEWRL